MFSCKVGILRPSWLSLILVGFYWGFATSPNSFGWPILEDQRWYVDSQAQAGGDGASWTTAWNRLSEIEWKNIKPGDTIYLSGGGQEQEKVYTGSLVVKASGESNKPITITRGIEPEHAGTPVLDGEYGPNNWYGVDLGWADQPPNHIVIRRLKIQHYASAGLSARSVKAGIVFEKNEIICGTQTNDSPRGIDIRWSSNFIIRNNLVTAPETTPAQTDGIYLQGNDRFLVEGNRVVISNRDGQGHSDALQLFENGNGVIRGNILIGPTAGDDNHTVVIEAQQADTLLDVYNNVSVMRGDLFNFMVFRNNPNQTQGQIHLYHNTFFGGSRALSIESYRNVIVRNNIIYSTTGQSLFLDDGPEQQHLSHNLVGVDPQFRSTEDQDFRLRPSSPAINAGTILKTVEVDILGVPRPQGTSPDIGAYEFAE